jgi:hypothetical protein
MIVTRRYKYKNFDKDIPLINKIYDGMCVFFDKFGDYPEKVFISYWDYNESERSEILKLGLSVELYLSISGVYVFVGECAYEQQ